MNRIIEKYSKEINKIEKSLYGDLYSYFKNCNYEKQSKEFKIISLKSLSDIQDVLYGTGFYIIFTSMNVGDNKCILKIGELTAIYRGQGYRVKERIMSHLFNSEYRRRVLAKEYKTNYMACLKINGENGIDIDRKPYLNFRWKVIVHTMKDSSTLIRRQTELAFDEAFNKPIASREK